MDKEEENNKRQKEIQTVGFLIYLTSIVLGVIGALFWLWVLGLTVWWWLTDQGFILTILIIYLPIFLAAIFLLWFGIRGMKILKKAAQK